MKGDPKVESSLHLGCVRRRENPDGGDDLRELNSVPSRLRLYRQCFGFGDELCDADPSSITHLDHSLFYCLSRIIPTDRAMKLSLIFVTLLHHQATEVHSVTPPTSSLVRSVVQEIPRGGGPFPKKKQPPSPPPTVATTKGGTATIPNEVFNLVKNIVGKHRKTRSGDDDFA